MMDQLRERMARNCERMDRLGERMARNCERVDRLERMMKHRGEEIQLQGKMLDRIEKKASKVREDFEEINGMIGNIIPLTDCATLMCESQSAEDNSNRDITKPLH